MGRTANDYRQLLQALLPTGPVWPRDTDATLTRVLQVLAQELARLDGRMVDLRDEADPRTTWEMLSDWEELCGLPGECFGTAETMAQRREAVISHLTSRGSQSRAFYIALAAQFGYDIEIEEFQPFQVGSSAGDLLFGEEWAHAWQVWVGEATQTDYFLAGNSAAGERLASWGVQDLECLIESQAPAHTVVLFGYEEE